MYKLGKIKLVLVFSTLIFVLTSIQLQACEIDFEVVKGKKSNYSKDDVLIVKVTVFLTHRNCPEEIQNTKFETSGLKILKATKWSKVSSNTYERKLKIKITDKTKKNLKIEAIRTCDKEGGYGELTLKAG